MSPLARIRQAAACSAFGFFPGWVLAMRLAVGAAGLALVAAGSAVAAAAGTAVGAATAVSAPDSAGSTPAAGADAPVQATAATGATAATQAPPQPTPVQAAATPPVTVPSKPVQLAPNATAEIARSALLTVQGTATADALQISIWRVSDKSLISSDDVTVAVDGKNQSVTHEKGGAYELPINDLRGDGARDVDVTVAHDGIREIVSGKVSVAEASSAQSLLRDHKQVAWWILNIVIVLIAATAVSRRKG
jgi:hypothetical protein